MICLLRRIATSLTTMTSSEQALFFKLFIKNGYVLNFSTASFDIFTQKAIGIALCAKYDRSKGKSLMAYCEEANEEDATKLLFQLFDYYEATYSEEQKAQDPTYLSCKDIRNSQAHSIISDANLKNIDFPYIREKSKRALEYIKNEEYDSALTLSRTLIEEVFIYGIEKKREIAEKKGDIRVLRKQIEKLYHMKKNNKVDERINRLLSGLFTTIDAIAEMRNIASDAHGQGINRIHIKEHHAVLFVNAANTMVEFILSVINNSAQEEPEQGIGSI